MASRGRVCPHGLRVWYLATIRERIDRGEKRAWEDMR